MSDEGYRARRNKMAIGARECVVGVRGLGRCVEDDDRRRWSSA